MKLRYFLLRHRIKKNQRHFLNLEKLISKSSDFNEKCELAYEAATFATTHTTDIFSSEIIENTFLKLSKNYSIKLDDLYKKGSILHVMTEAYKSGGHTRCVERFAQRLKEFEHSCVILNQNADLPKQLKNIMSDTGGDLIIYDNKETMVKRALKLRKLASSFEFIILHIHMNDPIALIAFGIEEFKRPIIFFNHASHAFWLGVAISDWVADLDTYTSLITKKYRGVRYSSILRIPEDNSKLLEINKEYARKRLRIPLDSKVIYSGGQFRKYVPIGEISFKKIIIDILSEDKNILFYIAGINKKYGFWEHLSKLFPNNVFLFDSLDYKTEYPYYLSAADLVLDSYPVGGGTALLDAIKAGKPVLSLTEMQEDFFKDSAGFCLSYDDFLYKIFRILNNKEFAKFVYSDIYKKYKDQNNKWIETFYKIIYTLPKNHCIHSFKRSIPKQVSNCSLITTRWTEQEESFGKILKKIRKWFIQIRLNNTVKKIKIFGFVLLNKFNIRSRNNIF